MSVIVKGMEMPKSCAECRFLEGEAMDGLCHASEKWLDDDDYFLWFQYPEGDIDDSKPANCPLIEIPPHGRLIDADEFEKYVELEYETREISHPSWIKFRVWCGDQPTIIEAEE